MMIHTGITYPFSDNRGYMPVTFEEVQQHKKFHGIDDLETTTAKNIAVCFLPMRYLLWIIMIFCAAH